MLSVIFDFVTYSREYSLDDGVLCYYNGDDGLGMSDVNLHSSRGYLQHGITIYDFRLEPRLIRLYLDIEGSSWADLWDKRARLLRLFTPEQDTIVLQIALPYGVRWIVCRYTGDLSLPSSSRRAFAQDVLISLIAPDPTFYDPFEQNIAFSTYFIGDDSVLAVPMEIPMGVGSSGTGYYPIVYTGSFRSYPLIRINGPIKTALIQNITTGKYLQINGTIAAGDWYEINCNYGLKTVVDKAGADKIATLSGDLEEFCLEAALDGTAYRVNWINIDGTALASTTSVDFRYYRRYVGI